MGHWASETTRATATPEATETARATGTAGAADIAGVTSLRAAVNRFIKMSTPGFGNSSESH